MDHSAIVRENATGGASASAGPAIVLDDVTVRFGDMVALDGVTARLAEHRIGVIGDNGSGKSTFARLLNGLVLPTRGCVTVLGMDTQAAGAAIRRRVGFLFQNPDNQLVMPTVAEDLDFGLKAHGVAPTARGTQIDTILARLGIAHLKERACAELAGGEKQLVALAGVLVLDPAILVCDEPTAMLDRRNARMFTEILATLPQQVVVVTHHTELLDAFDRVLVLDKGRIVADASPAQAIAAYASLNP